MSSSVLAVSSPKEARRMWCGWGYRTVTSLSCLPEGGNQCQLLDIQSHPWCAPAHIPHRAPHPTHYSCAPEGRGIRTHYIVMGSRGRYFLTVHSCICACTNACMYTYMCVCLCVCTSPKSTRPTHLHGLLQVLGGCTEAVEGEVLHNCADPLTSRGHHTKSPPLHLPDVNTQCKQLQSEVVHVARTACLPWVHTHTTCTYTHMRTHTHTYLYIVWLTRLSIN